MPTRELITINRSRLQPEPGRGMRYAWKWYYSATTPNGELGGTSLAHITWQIKRQGFTPVRSWETQ